MGLGASLGINFTLLVRMNDVAESKDQTGLSSEVVDVNNLTMGDRKSMFALFERYYENVSFSQFVTDLETKDSVALVRRPDAEVAGFSTISLNVLGIDSKQIRYVFSGDTILDSKNWGNPKLLKELFREAGRIKARHPGERLFWFSIFKGHRTFRILPNFFRDFVPSDGDAACEELERFWCAIARDRYGAHFDVATGLIDFGRSLGNLRREWALDDAAQRSRFAANFYSWNPESNRGVELACLAEFDLVNLKRYAARMFAKGLRDVG
jgi:hypothetical protein